MLRRPRCNGNPKKTRNGRLNPTEKKLKIKYGDVLTARKIGTTNYPSRISHIASVCSSDIKQQPKSYILRVIAHRHRWHLLYRGG